ncbi:MAG: 4Fe-4S binding protein, partial [Herbinix sp.]|nr:4Fe-4S binding protein [Herbinix sp.]
MSIAIDDCIFCGMCERRCPTGAIKVEKGKFSWSIERLQCIQCNYCGEVCTKKCLKMDNQC